MYDNEYGCGGCELEELGELGESSEMYLNINEIIEKEIDRRVRQEIADVEKIKGKYTEQEQIIRQLKNENARVVREKDNAERKCENEKTAMEKKCKRLVVEAQADALKSIFGNYKDGDTVYWIEDMRFSIDCKKCSGKGNFDVEVDGEKMKAACPQCNGSGKKTIENGKRVESKRPRGFYAKVDEKGNIYAVADLGDWTKKPLSCFMSKEKAEAKVIAHNDKIIAKYNES